MHGPSRKSVLFKSARTVGRHVVALEKDFEYPRCSDALQCSAACAVADVRVVADCVLRRSQQPNGRLKQRIERMWKDL